MPKKRLENALNAGKLISLGFGLNNAKPERLDLLYNVNTIRHSVEFVDESLSRFGQNEAKKKQTSVVVDSDSSSEADLDDESPSDGESKETLANRKSDDDESEKVEVLSLQFNENLNLIATGDSNGQIKIYDIFSGQKLAKSSNATLESNFKKIFVNKKLPNSVLNNMPTICLKWYPYANYSLNILYFANVNGYIGVLDRESQERRVIIQEEDEISCIDFNIDGSCLASVGKDYQIRLYDSNLNNSSTFNKITQTYGSSSSSSTMSANNNSSSFFTNISNSLSSILSPSSFSSTSTPSPTQTSSHSNRLQAVKFSNSSNDLFFTGGWDRCVKIWDKRSSSGHVNTISGPFICGSDAIDVDDNLLLTASWVQENALELWDIRNCTKRISTRQILNDLSSNKAKNEYLYACKFFSSTSHVYEFDNVTTTTATPNEKRNRKVQTNYSTVLACGSGTQSLHLIDYEKSANKQHLASINCHSPLYCLDAIYSCSLISCGGMRKFFTMMASSSSSKS